ncbi:RNB domain-containing ribonuclease [Pusillimonas sp. CC-YST705]|uniref:RNB domain-containing ribonuclease n=1 Tax=Mesopusillimonas faecipullorum TaxID=2755040 RepID=A0ABS8C9D1_9BURK|nr:RNB domain-containing ribonuclease [Mesopusillimonas faecipullorum]MCB5362639.1 RNB domain-containing ribonuclease [Mesopusillimonas faecipullorum]
MYVLYEDSAQFKAEKIFSESDSTLQVESESGKRSKIKKNAVIFTFDSPAPSQMLQQAQALAETLDVAFLWECAPQEELNVADFGQEYFGHPPSAVEKTALIYALHAAPAYFHRRGKGIYRPAPPDILQAALAAIEKKRLQAEQQQAWTEQMLAGQLPEAIGRMADDLLTRPDKNSLEWKAFDAAVAQSGKSAEQLLLDLQAWPHALAVHRRRFFAQYFPKGTAFPAFESPIVPDALPDADVEAYSLDDASTTEVDDALSVVMLDEHTARIGIHIAAPGLGIARGSQLDELARQRMSTVYMPGEKIPMLPEPLLQLFSLDEGQARPALSLYVTARLDTGEILDMQTRVERLTVRKNLRLHELENEASEAALNDPEQPLTYGHWLRPLWRFAQHLTAKRDAMRGKPENNNRIEYSFQLEGAADNPDSIVRLVPRLRNAPLDRIVAEYMILANSSWGGLLNQHGVPGVYRSQQTGRTRMSTHALPHESIGVPQYIWSTSPLRRYVDLVNQRQILAAAEHGVSARLVAPFKPKDADLFALIGAFDSQYAAWGEFQNNMERYWCLRWLRQQGITETEGEFLRDDLVRLSCVPMVVTLVGVPELNRGQRVRLSINDADELALTLHCRFLDVLAD